MSRLFFLTFILTFLLLIPYITEPKIAFALDSCGNYGLELTPFTKTSSGEEKVKGSFFDSEDIWIKVNPIPGGNFAKFESTDSTFYIQALGEGVADPHPLGSNTGSARRISDNFKFSSLNSPQSVMIKKILTDRGVYPVDTYRLAVIKVLGGLGGLQPDAPACQGPLFDIGPNTLFRTTCQVSLPKNINYDELKKTGYLVPSSDISIKDGGGVNFEVYLFKNEIVSSERFNLTYRPFGIKTLTNGLGLGPSGDNAKASIQLDPSKNSLNIKNNLGYGRYALVIALADKGSNWFKGCSLTSFDVSNDPTSPDKNSSSTSSGIGDPTSAAASSFPAGGCRAGDKECTNSGGESCNPITGGAGQGGIRTAIGCIPTEPGALVKAFLKFSAGVGGGLALLMMIFGSFKMITSQGNPELIKKGQEQFSSAVIGLFFIIFSVLLLQIIGVDILNLPDFRK